MWRISDSGHYALFAVIGGSLQVLAIESIVVGAFLGASIAGFKRSLWLVVAGLAAYRQGVCSSRR